MSPLKASFDYYLANQSSFVEKYNGKFVVLKETAVVGVFDNETEAVLETQKSHRLGTFLVQLVGPGKSSHTQTFYSRVAFG
jgi:hypothetical protein